MIPINRNLIALCVSFLLLFATSAPVFAQKNNELDNNGTIGVPSDLETWIGWIDLQHPEWKCAWNGLDYVCLWPGLVSYQISPKGAQFIVDIELQKKADVPLPSAANLFPSNIKISTENGKAVQAALNKNGTNVSVWLPRGKYKISGELYWQSLPHEIPIPEIYALVDIKTEGLPKDVLLERRKDKLWVGKVESSNQTDSISLDVMRQVVDGSPLKIMSLLRLKVSGAARPINLGQVIPNNSRPVSIQSQLPHYISGDGNLAIQVAPGEYDIRVLSLLAQPVKSIELPSSLASFWPKEEVWSFLFNNRFRSVEVDGAAPINADATQLPQDWKEGAVYTVNSGSAVNLKELRRAFDGALSNELHLYRNIWVDIYDKGLTVKDNFSGSIKKDFRLDVLPETKLGRALTANEPLLITKNPNGDNWGVELRNTDVQLEAISRYDNGRDISAVGWDTKVHSLKGLLHLPPSWSLVTIIGANSVQSAWLDSWTLLEIFLSFLIVLAVQRLLGVPFAILIALALVVNHREFLSPRMLFVHLLLLLAWRNLINATDSVWHRTCNVLLAATYCMLLIEGLAYSKLQFTQLLFPQLQSGTRYRSLMQELLFSIELSPFIWPAILFYVGLCVAWIIKMSQNSSLRKKILSTLGFAMIALLVMPLIGFVSLITLEPTHSNYNMRGDSRRMNEDSYSNKLSSQHSNVYSDLQEVAPFPKKAKAQEQLSLASGPALPTWEWRAHYFDVAGPVSSVHRLKFILLTPTVSRCLSGIRVLLTLSLLFLLWKSIWPKGLDLSRLSREMAPSHNIAAQSSVVLLLLISVFVSDANAEMPPEYLLNQLQTVMQSNNCNRKQCATIEKAQFEFKESAFLLSLQLVSEGVSVITVPGPLNVLTPNSVLINGKQHIGLRQNDAGFLEIRTEPGSNLIELVGNLPKHNAFSLAFPQTPLNVKVNAPDWFVEGLEPSGFVPDTLRFTTMKKGSTANSIQAASSNDSSLPSWVTVVRTVYIGESIEIVTRLIRVGDLSKELHLSLPLITDERITSGNVKLETGKATISFPARNGEVSFNSTLPIRSELRIVALEQQQLSEQWRVRCATTVSCQFTGISATEWEVEGQAERVFDPFPGESINVGVTKLSSISGEFITIDSLSHTITWGKRLLSGEVNIHARVTQQSPLAMQFPAGVNLLETKINGSSGGAVKDGNGQYKVLLTPGLNQVSFEYEKDFFPHWFEKAPFLSLSAPANNVTVNVSPSKERWILWVGGPAWGPCVVYWAKVIVVMMICLILSKMFIIPVSSYGSLLLGIGLSTLPIILFWVPLSWLVLLCLLPKCDALISQIPKSIRAGIFIVITSFALITLYVIVQNGLMVAPPMLIVGNNSDANMLHWYIDHTKDTIVQPWIISLPMYYWRVFSLIWAMWLVIKLFDWLRLSVTAVRQLLFCATHTVAQNPIER